MGTEQKGFIVYKDLHAVIDELTDEQVGQLFRGMIKYFNEGKAPKFDGVLKFVFIPIKQQMDRDSEKYDEKCEKNRENVRKRWAKVKGADVYDGIRTDTNYTNTNTNTNTNTKTKTTTDTNTNAASKQRGGGSSVDDEFNIWKKLDPEKVDQIYDVYPESGGFLIDEVFNEVKAKKKKVKDPVAYILGYAKNKNWDDKADHFN